MYNKPNSFADIVLQGAHCATAHIPQTAQSTAQSPSSPTPPFKAGLACLCHVHCAYGYQWLTNRSVMLYVLLRFHLKTRC